MPIQLKEFQRVHPHKDPIGYSWTEVEELMGERMGAFKEWINRQTIGLNDNFEACIYPYDVWRFYTDNSHKDWWD